MMFGLKEAVVAPLVRAIAGDAEAPAAPGFDVLKRTNSPAPCRPSGMPVPASASYIGS